MQTSYDIEPKSHHSCRSWCLALIGLLMAAAAIAFAVSLGVTYTKWKDADNKVKSLEAELAEENTTKTVFGAVITGSTECSKIGLDILTVQGGSAVDAAIASLFCLGVIHPDLMGIGGGSFMTIYDKSKGSSEKQVRVLDAREVAPLEAHENMFVNDTHDSFTGAAAVGVPGELKGYYEAWKEYGRLPWRSLVEPAITLCEEGFRVTNHLAVELIDKAFRIHLNKQMNDTFLHADGTPLNEGEIMKRPNLAQTLRAIAEDGDASFYNGALTSSIISDLQECDGTTFLAEKDLNEYETHWKTPVTSNILHDQYTMYTVPPPSSGAVLQYILRIMDGYDISASEIQDEESTGLFYHRFVEACKFGFAKRTKLGDPAFVDIDEVMAELQEQTNVDITRAKIKDDSTQPLEYYDATFQTGDDAGTGTVVVLSPEDTAVSVTTSVNYKFGSTCLGRRTGILFNNEMNDFSTPGEANIYGIHPSPANFVAPKKRPLSSMSPSIVLDKTGSVSLVISAAGGPWIVTTIARMTLESLWLKKDLATANRLPILHHQLLPNFIFYETEMPEGIVDFLRSRQHVMFPSPRRSSASVVKISPCEHTSDVSTSSSSSACMEAICDWKHRLSCSPATVKVLTR